MIRYIYLFKSNDKEIFFDRIEKIFLCSPVKSNNGKSTINALLLGGVSSILYSLSYTMPISNYCISLICFIFSAIAGLVGSIILNKRIVLKMKTAHKINFSDIQTYSYDIQKAVDVSENSLLFPIVALVGIFYSYFYNNIISVACTSIVICWVMYTLPFHNLFYIRKLNEYTNN